MKKVENKDELRPEYHRDELGPGIRGKYFQSYQDGTNLVLLSPDVAAAFPTEKAVNDALRSLIKVAQRSTGLTRRSTPPRSKKSSS
jgi:hypothetical protein